MDQPLLKRTSGKVYSYSSVEGAKDEAPLLSPMETTNIRATDSHVALCTSSTLVEPSKANIVAGSYDYCLVLPAKRVDLTSDGRNLLEALKELGFDTVAYRGGNEGRNIIVLLRLPLEALRSVAEADELYLMLDPSVAKTAIQHGDSSHGIQPAFIAHRPDITSIPPFQYIYAPYRRSLEHLYAKADASHPPRTNVSAKAAAGAAEDSADASHPFTPLVRLKTIAMLLFSRPLDNSDGINIDMHRRLREGTVLACFPLHDSVSTAALEKKLTLYPIRNLPLRDLKDYLGEKIGVYFAFAEHLASWLVYPAMIGIPLQLFVFLRGSLSETALAVFAYFVALWGVFMLEFWKRKEKLLSLQWGTVSFEENEVERPDFQGELITSYIDGAQVLHFPSHKRVYFMTQSLLGVSLLLLLALGVVVSIYIIRFTIEDNIGVGRAQIVASLLNSAQIQILNYFYEHILQFLTNRENHRTDTQYEDSLIVKIFVFLFVNSYASFYYLAFLAESVGDCPATGCMYPLAINLAVVFGTSLASSTMVQLLLPWLMYQYQYRNASREVGKEGKVEMTRPESEHLLALYDHLSTTIDDYAELAVGFGYTALFVAALPIAALFYLFYSMLQIRADGWKLLHLYRRPLPRGCEDIGTWQGVFLMITVASVVTNAGLSVFTMQQIDHWSTTARYWCFLLFQWTCFTLQAFIMVAIPDVPEEMSIQLKRAEFIKRKLIDRIPDTTV